MNAPETEPACLQANGISLCYEDLGHPQDPAIILIMGLACQMTAWPPTLINSLLKSGFRVILFDNRDIGLSTEMPAGKKTNMPANFLRYKLGMAVPSSYNLSDMAGDTRGLMDSLGIASAHIVGVSMGGMIAQILAARHPDRVRSLTLLMSSDNSPRNPAPSLRVLWRMNGGGVKGHHVEAARARSMAFWKVVKSPLYPVDEVKMAEHVDASYRRSYRPAGVLRQMGAIMATGSLAKLSCQIPMPVCVVHGESDLLVRPVIAKKLTSRIPDAELVMIPGMGHDLPEQLVPSFVASIRHTTARAQ